MHGFCSGSSLLVNAEADSMGGIFGSGVGISTETSPCQVAIEKVQAELRVEHDVREERRKELEYLEKGGNPLDFKFLAVAPVSVQSSSLADQRHGQFRTCEAKDSSALAASPHGDSIGSSGRQGATLACEPNSADNFDGDNELIGSQGKPTYASRSNIIPSEHSSQLDGSQNVRESEDSPIFQPKKAYRRRNRSKTNRDNARSSSTAIGFCGGHLSDRHGVVSKVLHDSTSNNEVDGSVGLANPTNGVPSEDKLDLSSSKHMHDDLDRQNVKDVVASNAAILLEPDPFIGSEYTTSAVSAFPKQLRERDPQNDGVPKQLRERDHLKDGEKCSQTGGIVSSIALTLKGLDSESSCTQASVGVDRNENIYIGLRSSLKYKDSIEERVKEKLPLDLAENINDEVLVDTEVADVARNISCINDNHVSQNYEARSYPEEDEGGTNKNPLSAQDEAQGKLPAQKTQSNQHTNDILIAKQCSLDDTVDKSEGLEKPQQPDNPSVNELTKTSISCSASLPELQLCDENQPKVVDKELKERILEEARNIIAKRKRREELFLGSTPKEYCQKTHWDFVLEEMAWMANDFAQERVWKRTAATQLCHRAAFASRLRLEEQSKYGRDKIVAKTLARAVADFWHSAALLVGENANVSGVESTAISEKTYNNWNGNGGHDEEYQRKNIKLAVQGYAVRFLQHNRSILSVVKDASSETPECVSTFGVPELTYQNQHAEENLFYVVPHRAMEAYRKSIERYLVQCERASKYMQEVHTSTEFDSQENGYEEDEGENLYYLPGCFESSNVSKFSQKKWSNPNLYSRRLYDVGGDFSYGPCMENRTNSPESSLKRPVNGLNICPIPTKRVRTASRQRVVGPFRSGAAGFMPIPSRTEASSGDTNSFQDDQSTQGGESLIPKGLEVESGMNYDKQAAFDSTEFTVKPKKKKKTKHQGTAYEPRWQADYSMQNEQRNHFKKRLQSHQFDSYGNSGPFGHHAKKPKTAKQSLDNPFENTTLMSGSVASPVGSQMSNMSNTNKLIKLIGGRDRGRKTKSLKVASGQIGPGSPWSLFEDQALVVLVHDMGPNWELVSDAINCTLHFKCIFRKPKECKDRHRILLEKNGGDGADTEDSGSSQPYPSTLPGIPKGGARQLFQQLRGPVEEDTIKCHFKKIILIGQQLHGRKKEPKQLVSAHSSHFAALSQVVPKNLNGGVLTPLDLCDMAMSSPDVFSIGHQGPYTGGLPLPNQVAVQSMLPSSSSSPLQGSAPAQLNGTVRDGRYGIPRTNLPVDEQERIQHYNHMLSGRNIQQPHMSVPDRSGHMLPSGNGMVMSGMNRSMSMPKPGVQGVSSSSIQSSGSMATSKTAGMTSSMNMHSGATPGQGSSLLRPRDGLHIARNPEHSRKMSSEMQVQGSHTNNQGLPAFGGLSSTFPSQSSSPPGTTYPVHNQQQQHQVPRKNSNVLNNSHHRHVQGSAHLGSTEQQAFAMRLARDRQLQQRMLPRQPPPQQNQQFPASSALLSHVPSQSQLPVSAALPKSSHMQLQAASQPATLPPLLAPSSPVSPVVPQQQPHHGLVQTALSGTSVMINQGEKQKQHPVQQVQQSSRHHPVQRQPSQSQQAKFLKGMGRSNMAVNQKHPVDSSHLIGLSGSPGIQLEKGEKVMHPTQDQVYPIQSSSLSKPVVPPTSAQSHSQQKLNSNTAPASAKKVRQVISHHDSSNSNQAIRSPTIPSNSHQQLKVHQQPPSNLINDTNPTIQKVVAQNRVANSDELAQLQNDQQLANSSSISTNSGIPPACVKSAHAVPVAGSSGSLQWKTSESPSDSIIPTNSQLGSIGSPPVSNSSTNEPVGPGG